MSVAIEEVNAEIVEPPPPPADTSVPPAMKLDIEAMLRALRREASRAERWCVD